LEGEIAMNASTWVEIAVIISITLYNQMGKRKMNAFRTIIPIAVALLVGNKYLHDVPVGGANSVLLVISVVAGILFGGLLVLTTKIGRDSSGALYTHAGLPYLMVWILELGSRLAFAYYANQYPASVGHFFISLHISPNIIGPAFMLMTMTMLVVRVSGIFMRAKLFPARAHQVS
jgi:hypothetical protein